MVVQKPNDNKKYFLMQTLDVANFIKFCVIVIVARLRCFILLNIDHTSECHTSAAG